MGLVDADRLVEPDPARHRQAQAQSRQRHRAEHQQRGPVTRVGLAAPREAPAWTEQLGLVRTPKATEERSY
jgi:hypothetical protein